MSEELLQQVYSTNVQLMRESMMRTGRAELYLSGYSKDEWTAYKQMAPHYSERDRYKITDFSGEFVLRPIGVKPATGRGWYGYSYPIMDVWFIGPDGYEWYGRAQGHWGSYMRCRRVKKQSLSYVGVTWEMKNGRQIALQQMTADHLVNCINLINRSKGRWRGAYLDPLIRMLEAKRQMNIIPYTHVAHYTSADGLSVHECEHENEAWHYTGSNQDG